MIDRRTFVGASVGLLVWPASVFAREPRRVATLPSNVTAELEKSPFVYISPLQSNGEESRCHGEVWYDWVDGAVVVNTAPGTWKARSLSKGLDRARIWVGDHGRWRKGLNRGYKKAPHFDARAEFSKDAELLEHVLATYEKKYPDEIGRWRDKMRDGFHSGERVLIRYVPDGAART